MQLSSICNQKGLVMAGFILAKEGLKFKVIIGNEISNIFIEELLPFAKFFGVTFKETDEHVKLSVLKNDKKFLFLKNNYFGVSATITPTRERIDQPIEIDDWRVANALLKNFYLTAEDVGKYRPLEIFYDQLRVSFDKGCYRGQEIVARMKYLGVDRRKFSAVISEENYVIDSNMKLISSEISYKGYKIFNCSINKDSLEIIKNEPLIQLIM
jgi:folate-binding protein YgfZ